MEVLDNLTRKIRESLNISDAENIEIIWEHPGDLSHGDYSTNIALAISKHLGKNPKVIAEEIVESLLKENIDYIEKIEVAGGGFINIYLSRQFFTESIKNISENPNFGKTEILSGKKFMVEYTDPNPFKEFHIGHLMSNTIGEAFSRIVESNGAEVKRACYQGDVGLHVAKAILGMKESSDSLPNDSSAIDEWAKYLGACYTLGATLGEEEKNKSVLQDLNKKIYERSDEEVNKLYDIGRKKSLEYFEEIYKKLGTKFDYYFFESASGQFGKEIVLENLEKGIFEKGEGDAVIFRGEKYNSALHTRVYINSQGLPTYEAKELGISKIKYDTYQYDNSIIITGNEINDYFKVLLESMKQVFPELEKKTKHISHGMLRLPSGKMSSRTGDVITGETLLASVSERVVEKMKETEREPDADLVNKIAVSALKYSVLKQTTGKDIIFDFDKSLSFEGDSGPYMCYSHARARSILEKAIEMGIGSSTTTPSLEVAHIERILYRFPEIVTLAYRELAPHAVAGYLIELARSFNSFYADGKILDLDDPVSAYKVSITKAFAGVVKRGLYILGIDAPERM